MARTAAARALQERPRLAAPARAAEESRAFRWSSASRLEILASEEPASASGISTDGRVIVGYEAYPEQKAVRWTSQGAHALGCSYCVANRTNRDGSVIIGQQYVSNDAGELRDLHPYVWDEVHGVRDFRRWPSAMG